MAPMLQARIIGFAFIAMFAVVLVSRTMVMVDVQLPNDERIDELSSIVAVLKRENQRLTKPLDCWDNDTFGGYNYTEKHPISESRLDFFTGRNSRACRRARTNYGDETKYIPVLHKLARGKCITVVTLGGSISYGGRVGGRTGSYTAKLIESLDHHIPCKTANGEAGNHIGHNLAMGGTKSGFHARNIQATPSYYDLPFSQADIVINEFAINDNDGEGMKDIDGIDASKKVQYWNEVLIQMLKLKCPQAVIIYLEASAMHWNLGNGSKRPPPYRTDTEGHLDVVKYYDLMQIDMMRMIGPLGTQEKNGYLEHVYFMDGVHPGQWGHALIASVLSFTLREMISNIAEIETDFRVAEPNLERDRKFMILPKDWVPLLASFSMSFKEKKNVKQHTIISTNGRAINGWSFNTDNPDKPNRKMLMSREPGSCLEIDKMNVTEPVTEFSADVMKSYENFGVMSIALLCEKETIHVETVNCTWESKTSQLSSVSAKLEKPLVGCKDIRFNVCHLASDTPTKVKLLGVALYKANKCAGVQGSV